MATTDIGTASGEARTCPPGDLLAGVARIDITPPMPADCVGFVRRAAPATGVLAPLTATALVLEDAEGHRAVLIAMDLIALGCAQADRMRNMVGAAVGASPDAVFLNYSHTHAGPHVTEGSLRKLGGSMRTIFDKERLYIESLPYEIVGVAAMAARQLVPVRLAAGAIAVPGISVNRRERAPDGRTILGWNPDGPLDDELIVLKLAAEDGQTLAIISNFACHPVVLGGENPNVGPDFPGALRALVERNLGGLCLYLAGAAGNVLPLEGFHEEAGPEIAFGERLGYAAMHVAAQTFPYASHIQRLDYGSVTPISLYRRVLDDPQVPQRISWAAVRAELPLKPLPTLDDVEKLLDGYRANLERAIDEGRPQWALNPIDYHVQWAEHSVDRLKSGEEIETSVSAYVQAIRIGDIAIVGLPGEPFNEIGRAVKDRSVAPFTLFAGYSNGYIGYFPTAAEFPFGGYEPSYSHHNTELLEQVAPESEDILVRSCLEAISRAFAEPASS
jgi:neutral ceramidase